MSNRSFLFSVAILLIVVLCACVASIGIVVNKALVPSAPTTTRAPISPAPSFTPASTFSAATATPAPTYTLVIQPGTPLPPLGLPAPTRANFYNVIVPTPTAQMLKYPVTYDAHFNVVTYPVSGETLDALARSLDANALVDAHDPLNRYYALTNWNLTSRWTWQPTVAGCEVKNAQVTIDVTLTLPALASSDLAPEVRQRWDTFIANTITHETGHVRLAFDGARSYQRDVGYLLPAVNCSIIETRLNDLFRKDLNAIDQANVDYDTATQHGTTQGAVFP